MKQNEEEKSAAPALTKGFAILDLLAREPGLGFAAIRTKLGLPNSSCHHLISTLCQLGALQMLPDRGYVLGLRLLELGTVAAGQRPIERIALPALRRLAEDVQLTCHLGVMEGMAAIYLLKVEGQRQIRVNTWVGKRLSLHSSSLGKVLLAWLPEEEQAAILQRVEWVRRCANTVTDPVLFRAHLREVRARGWAFDDQEDAESIRCVAAPVRDMQGRVVAAISAVGTVLDIDTDRFAPLADRVAATAREISTDLGHPGQHQAA
ncbi:IclR family transcriptional regulator [Rhodovastum atsumiense]|uniref:IclR family transcriptional regulator n=1 Tax=Rhodovastum atsumiense TaxID=504468 RepID=A0A5M6IPR6_9PROT|nr:IclR family transcriptional regulator [Rhodovastum atsumiense]KAA5610280.1 IclR family transcriptional regulator [Rhodovastum atsumiense]CAH2602233.1 IclR family transcriptional regulator [Rhodovastum atsumiense]